MDPNKTQDRLNLMSAVDHHRQKLDPIRKARRRLLKRTSGSEWYPEGANEDTPINQMSQAEKVLVQHLAGGEPQALVIPEHPELTATAYDQMMALNKLSQRLSMRKKLRRLIRDAIYGIGICRIGMTAGQEVPIREIAPELDEEGTLALGQMVLEVVSLEAWVHDTSADTLDESEFLGHAYWVDEADLKAYLPGVNKEDLQDDEKRQVDEHGSAMAGAISRGEEGPGREDYDKRYWLWDLWLPRENALVTTQVNGTGEIAHVREWNSRPGGPYLYLYYDEVPDQAIPKSIMADLALVHDSLNSTFRKLIDATAGQKTILGYKPGHEDDAERIRDAGSRAIVQMRDPNSVQEFNFNGPDGGLMAMLMNERELASIIGGNTDALGGFSSQAPTLGQEEIVQGQASGKVAAMEIETVEFVRELFEAARWYLYHEQIEPVRFDKQIPGTDIRIPGQFGALEAEQTPGDYDAFALKIEPYSMVYRSPDQRLQTIMQLWQGVIMPLLQGGLIRKIPDTDALLEIIAQYSQSPELRSILRDASEEEMAMMGGGGEPRQAPTTTRNYVRHGAPGPSQQGKAAMMIQAMQGQQQAG